MDEQSLVQIDEQIASLITLDNTINQKELILYQKKRQVRARLKLLRKTKREILTKLGRRPGRPHSISKEERCVQLRIIKEMRAEKKTWHEVGEVLGYSYSECIRILNVFGKGRVY